MQKTVLVSKWINELSVWYELGYLNRTSEVWSVVLMWLYDIFFFVMTQLAVLNIITAISATNKMKAPDSGQ
jgi:hypothetical protein